MIGFSEGPNSRDHWKTVVDFGDEVTVVPSSDGYWQVWVEDVLVYTVMTQRGALKQARKMRTPPERVGNFEVRPTGGGYWMLTTPGAEALVAHGFFTRRGARREARRLSTSPLLVA